MQKRISPQIAGVYLYILPAVKTAFDTETSKLAVLSFTFEIEAYI